MNAAVTMKLVVICCECGAVEHVTFNECRLEPKILYKEVGWLLSIVDRSKLLMGLVCKSCAPKVYPPELLAAAREAMKERS